MPKGPRIFIITFNKDGLARFGGLLLFHLFCKSLRLKRFLQTYVLWPDYSDRIYSPTELFLSHLFSIVAGIGRVVNTQSLFHNGLVPPLLGVSKFPHQKTLRDFLWRFTPENLSSLQSAHDKFRAELFHRLGLSYSAIIDADMTVLTVFGHQEQAVMGYNPRYHGKRSYAPLISSEGCKGFSLGMELRAGNLQPQPGAWNFLEPIIDKLPSTIASSRTRTRLDASFYKGETIQSLDDKNIGYVIVARMVPPLKTRMLSARYHEFAQGWEAAEFTYPVTSFSKEHRFIAIRRPKGLEPEEVQRSFFTFKDYLSVSYTHLTLPTTPYV